MKKVIFVFAVFLATFAFSVLNTTAQASDFRFRADRANIGKVFHYLKTNIDGTQPENIALYISSAVTIESFKFHEKGTRAGLVVAEMDWENFVVRQLRSYQVTSPIDRKLFATLTFDSSKREIDVSIPVARPESETVKVLRLPFHVYNFDLASLNVSFPHMVKPKRTFTIGIADPTFKNDGPLMVYRGDLTVVFEKDGVRNGAKCRKYSASGPGVGGRGVIWVNKKGGYIEDMEFDVPDNPDWKTFKLKLEKIEKMTPQNWEAFISSRF
jgi:hypothetical protein